MSCAGSIRSQTNCISKCFTVKLRETEQSDVWLFTAGRAERSGGRVEHRDGARSLEGVSAVLHESETFWVTVDDLVVWMGARTPMCISVCVRYMRYLQRWQQPEIRSEVLNYSDGGKTQQQGVGLEMGGWMGKEKYNTVRTNGVGESRKSWKSIIKSAWYTQDTHRWQRREHTNTHTYKHTSTNPFFLACWAVEWIITSGDPNARNKHKQTKNNPDFTDTSSSSTSAHKHRQHVPLKKPHKHDVYPHKPHCACRLLSPIIIPSVCAVWGCNCVYVQNGNWSILLTPAQWGESCGWTSNPSDTSRKRWTRKLQKLLSTQRLKV